MLITRHPLVYVVALVTCIASATEPVAHTPADRPGPVIPESPAHVDHLRDALHQRGAFAWKDVSLDEFAQDLSRILDVDVFLDNRALGDAGLDATSRVSLESLVVSQTGVVHDEIEAMLTELRKARRGKGRKSRPDANGAKPFGDSPFDEISSVSYPPSGPLPDNADRDALRDPQARIACALYAGFVGNGDEGNDKNVAFSPYGITSAIAMASAGARSETSQEFLKWLGIDLPPEPPAAPTFRADRPFVFFVRDTRTDTILFMGRVMNPTK
jgi:hypothetical protein